MKNKLSLFYNDLNEEEVIREQLIETACYIFADNGIEGITLEVIGKSCDLSIGTVNKFYNDIDYLVMDVAYSVLSAQKWDETLPNNEMLNGCDLLEYILRSLYDLKGRGQDLVYVCRFINQFDLYLLKLDESNEALQRYISLYVPHLVDEARVGIREAFERGIFDGSINISINQIDFNTEYVIQSLFSITTRVAIKEVENPSINADLIVKHIDLIMSYLRS